MRSILQAWPYPKRKTRTLLGSSSMNLRRLRLERLETRALLTAVPFSVGLPITTEADGAVSVFAADLDNDGDQDVLSASHFDNTIAWYENVDGLGTMGPRQIITSSAIEAEAVVAADLDGDGDLDVLSASSGDNTIAWYENLGGGSFGSQQVITTAATKAFSVFAADLDGDGDQDVLSASWDDDTIAWYENVDGQGTFGGRQIISATADFPLSVFAADLDGDGDIDALSASSRDDTIAWYENIDGAGTFGSPQIVATLADRPSSVYAVDVDRDGDVDILSASRGDDKIAWYENLDGAGAFGLYRSHKLTHLCSSKVTHSAHSRL